MRIHQGLSVAAMILGLGGAAMAQGPAVPGQPDANNGGTTVGIGVICNTDSQAEQYVSLRQKGQDISPAMQTVNKQAQQPLACGIAAVAFVPGETLDSKASGSKLMRIVRIKIIAGYDGSGWHQVPTTTQYAIIETDGMEI